MTKKLKRRGKRLAQKSEYYRIKAAKKAAAMSKLNKILKLFTIVIPVIVSSTLALGLNGSIDAKQAQIFSIILGILSALIQGFISVFYDPSVFVKLFHASSEFMMIHKYACTLNSKLESNLCTDEQFEIECDKIELKYESLKVNYVEYLVSSTSYYWRKRTITVPGEDVNELLPWKTE